ncbi:unnamed protein product, partial [Mesorhabditis spiculigera]
MNTLVLSTVFAILFVSLATADSETFEELFQPEMPSMRARIASSSRFWGKRDTARARIAASRIFRGRRSMGMEETPESDGAEANLERQQQQLSSAEAPMCDEAESTHFKPVLGSKVVQTTSLDTSTSSSCATD